MKADLLPAAVELGATNPPGMSALHGETHWKCVALTGLFLARLTPPPVDLPFLYVFAQLHDICRLNDDDDPRHGARAAHLFATLVIEQGVEGFYPYAQRTQDMMYALDSHVGTRHARDYDNPNVGLCWDADRLNLWRVGKTPDPAYLTTSVARLPESLTYGLGLSSRQVYNRPFPSWSEIRRLYEEMRHP